MKTLYFLFIPFLILTACTNEQNKIDMLKDEVIRIHDEVMPKTSEINKISRELKTLAQDSTLIDASHSKIRSQVIELSKADEAMSTWMAEYQPPKKGAPFEETMKKLNVEKEKIIKVQEMMLTSLKNGKELLKELKKN